LGDDRSSLCEDLLLLDLLKLFLQDKRLLLLLDNFEQVVAAAPQVEHLLSLPSSHDPSDEPSGALCTAVLDWSLDENVGFSAFISIGSMMDVGWGDQLDYLRSDPRTRSIVIYIETFGDDCARRLRTHPGQQPRPAVWSGAALWFGGQLVEVYQDRAVALPPLTTMLARRMMEQTRIFTALKGVRGRPPVDLAALEHLLVRFSYLVTEQR
jgi:hypothetical protein